MAVLYVARDRRVPTRHDVGSVLCLELVDAIAHTHPISVVDVSEANARPPGVAGTPTLREASGEQVVGFAAVQRLQAWALEAAEARGRASVAKSKKQGASAPPARRPDPPPEDAEATENAELWGTRIDDNDVEAADEPKISSEDLARANASRQMSNSTLQQAPPPLPPIN